jgi:hypothetical protein
LTGLRQAQNAHENLHPQSGMGSNMELRARDAEGGVTAARGSLFLELRASCRITGATCGAGLSFKELATKDPFKTCLHNQEMPYDMRLTCEHVSYTKYRRH